MTMPQRIVVALSTALCVQMIAALLWAGAAAQRLDTLEEQLRRMAVLEVRAARLEEQTLHLRSALDRIENKLDRALHDEVGQ
ncbi:hypothetical protein [Parvularcula lutaonensis]|uniref:Uncharacterized protein n=1 Tax=Parvularcula lutaonensis TaxID=491923 RepID=A0ABV7MDG5_9PROT|nr:hypothetical protein [Parvularcula lutaonensis]GGY53169.1 hypothetical protein GCM10007148_23000 [Parvularcula lutaonensis]